MPLKTRCFGKSLEYAHYHDTEWGIPIHDDRDLFELLILEGAQAGLSFETILKKREAYRLAFHHFCPKKVAAMSDEELELCLKNPGLIRNRLKIYSTRKNGQVFLKIQEEWGTFDRYLWHFTEGLSVKNQPLSLKEIPASTPLSVKISKDLQKKGMSFVGPTIIYAYMQAAGLVEDHIQTCWRFKAQ